MTKLHPTQALLQQDWVPLLSAFASHRSLVQPHSQHHPFPVLDLGPDGLVSAVDTVS